MSIPWRSTLAVAGAVVALGAVRYSAATVAGRDVLDEAQVSTTAILGKLAESSFEAPGAPRPLHDRAGVVAALASVAAVVSKGEDSLAMADGMIVARIDADRAVPAYGLNAGANFLWIDRLGSTDNPWRAIIVSTDGRQRQFFSTVKYTPEGSHHPSSTIADHARRYCDGASGCFFPARLVEQGDDTVNPFRQFEGTWTRCTEGCCEMSGGLNPKKAR